ncbi:MAG TPA: TetR/AcrR family transcriptional regulator [Burkholderiales bacterium]|nr:TetR/AcrR family transcriptional regulator [Burkholderiales bacterium]
MAKSGTRQRLRDPAKARPKPGRPKDEAKGSAILRAAGTCFLRHGLEGASMDAIAREAGVSKLTVYSHFQNKEALFKAVIRAKCGEFSPPESFLAMGDLEPRTALTRIAGSFMGLMLAPEVLAMHRVVTGESANSPKVAQLMYEAGPEPAMAAFAELLAAYDRKGLLAVREPARAADHFFSMLKGDLHSRALLNIGRPPAEAELKRHLDDCVEVFLRAYAPR